MNECIWLWQNLALMTQGSHKTWALCVVDAVLYVLVLFTVWDLAFSSRELSFRS